MSITSIALPSSAATIGRPDGSQLTENGVIASGNFGISNGVPYFDTGAASIGDGAALGYDGGIGHFFLHSGETGDAGAIHLMAVRFAARNAFHTFDVDLVSQLLRQCARDRLAEVSLEVVPGGRSGSPVVLVRMDDGQAARQEARIRTVSIARADGYAARCEARNYAVFAGAADGYAGRCEARSRPVSISLNDGARARRDARVHSPSLSLTSTTNVRQEARARITSLEIVDGQLVLERNRAWMHQV